MTWSARSELSDLVSSGLSNSQLAPALTVFSMPQITVARDGSRGDCCGGRGAGGTRHTKCSTHVITPLTGRLPALRLALSLSGSGIRVKAVGYAI